MEFVMKNIISRFALIAALFGIYSYATLTSAVASPVVLFDQAHDQRFVIEKEEPLHLSRFASILKAEGLSVKSSTSLFTDDLLKGVDAIVISGPFKAIEPQEVDVLVRFLERGGRLAAMLHIGSPFTDLLHRLEVDFTNYVLYEQENIIDNDPRNFQVRALNTDSLFNGLDHFSLYGGWALMNTAPSAKIIASTSPKGWVDLNGDGKLSRGDVVQSFGVVVSGAAGAGRFVIFGDDAIFQNKFLDEQNRQLAINLARWLKQ
jgi:hypothetical protein